MGPILVILAVFLFPGITQKFNRELTENSVTRLLDDHHFNQLLWLLHTKRKTIEKMPPARRVFYHYLEAEAYSGIGEFRLAEQCYTRMVKEAKQAKGENSPEYTTALFALATFYYRLGDRPKAERLAGEVARFNDAHAMPEGFQQATTLLQTDSVPVSLIPHLSPSEIRRRTKKVRKEYGDAHPFYADALRNEILLAINDADSARLHQLVDEQCQVIRRIIQRNFPFMSGHQQTYLFLKYRDDLDRVYQIQHLMPDAEWAGHCYANALFTKGLLLRSSNRLRNALSHQDDTTTLGKYDRWLERQRKIAYLALRKGPIARMRRLIEEEKAEREEKELAARTLEWQEAKLAVLQYSSERQSYEDQLELAYTAFSELTGIEERGFDTEAIPELPALSIPSMEELIAASTENSLEIQSLGGGVVPVDRHLLVIPPGEPHHLASVQVNGRKQFHGHSLHSQ